VATELSVALLTLGDPCKLSGGYLYHRRMAELAHNHDAAINFFSLPDRPFPLPALAVPATRSRIAGSHPDAVVVDSIASVYLAKHPSGFGDTPVAASVHQNPGGVDSGSVRRAIQRPLDLTFHRRCDLILAASDLLAEALVAAGISARRIRVVSPGRDVAAPGLRARIDLRQGHQMAVLSVANWLPNKGILDLLDAVGSLPEPLAMLHLAGDPLADRRYGRRVWRRLRQAELRDRVVIHGRLTPQEVADLYENADIFASCSLNEAFATAAVEAMAFGLPVVGWRTGNVARLVFEQEGALVAPGDVRGLAEAMIRLAADAKLRARMGAAAARRVRSFPTWDRSAALFFDALRSIS